MPKSEMVRLSKLRLLNPPLTKEEILESVTLIARQHQLKIKVKQPYQAFLNFFVCTVVGGIFFGYPGILIGAIIGAIAAYGQGTSIEPLWCVISNMNDVKKTRLVDFMRKVFNNLGITNLLIIADIIGSRCGPTKLAIIAGMEDYFGQKWLD